MPRVLPARSGAAPGVVDAGGTHPDPPGALVMEGPEVP